MAVLSFQVLLHPFHRYEHYLEYTNLLAQIYTRFKAFSSPKYIVALERSQQGHSHST